jgi:hypothetical protein
MGDIEHLISSHELRQDRTQRPWTRSVGEAVRRSMDALAEQGARFIAPSAILCSIRSVPGEQI